MHTLLASRPNVVASTRVDATRRARCERGLSDWSDINRLYENILRIDSHVVRRIRRLRYALRIFFCVNEMAVGDNGRSCGVPNHHVRYMPTHCITGLYLYLSVDHTQDDGTRGREKGRFGIVSCDYPRVTMWYGESSVLLCKTGLDTHWEEVMTALPNWRYNGHHKAIEIARHARWNISVWNI